MLKAEQHCPLNPVIPGTDVLRLRVNLIREETDELLTQGFGDPDGELGRPSFPDIVEVADALADILVVTLGCAVACGIDIAPVFDEVMRSNMTKFIDGHKREDGKWIKGPSYSPANIKPILDAQQ